MSKSPILQPLFDFKHSLPVQLRFNDVDIFGHVNNSVYLQFLDLGKLRYFDAVLGTDFSKSGLGIVVANINCDFFAPTFMNEELVVDTQCEHIGQKSMKLLQRIVAPATGSIKCVAHTIMVGFDLKTMTSAAIPDDVRKKFEAYEGHNLISEV
ncbi:MAG: acyl-CoA thioesterase [Muribaculaceae bacterium]|nr:acyl-CoA thioesterase [Muribaculaceae bacterium]